MNDTTNTESVETESAGSAEAQSGFEQYGLSDKWLKRFKLLKDLGADEHSIYAIMKSNEFKALPSSDRLSVSLNLFVIILGPTYYLFKKMWMKAGFLFASMWVLNGVLSLVEWAAGFSFPSVIFWVVPHVICAQLANYDYYRHVTAQEKIWPQVPDLFKKPVGIIAYLVASFVFIAVAMNLALG